MSVSAELLCSFELLKPLDSSALKSHIKKGRNKRNTMLNSPVSILQRFDFLDSSELVLTSIVACKPVPAKLLIWPLVNVDIIIMKQLVEPTPSRYTSDSPRTSSANRFRENRKSGDGRAATRLR